MLVASDYFHTIFSSSLQTFVAAIDEALAYIPNTVWHELNQLLVAPYTVYEVKLVLFQLHPSKAPRNDGYSALFFQKFWESIKVDFT